MGWLFIVLAFSATVYRNGVKRIERNVTDDVSRENALKRLDTDIESLEWLNSFFVKFWLIYEPVLSETVIGVANQVLAGATPGFIESLSLKEFTLGTKPPQLISVRSYPRTDPDVIVMDWKFAFTPNDTEDMTARQLKDKKNPKVELSVRVGKGVVSKGLPILVEDMSSSGLMRVRIKLMPTFPLVKTVDVSFLEPPQIDFVLKPIGGDTFGFDINIIPGLESFIKSMVNSNLGPMLYAPNAFQINVEEMMSAAAPDSAIGVLAVTIFNASGLSGTESIGKDLDPYLKLSLNNGEELARSDIKKATKNPRWNETKYILVHSLAETLTFNVLHFKDFKKDKTIGTASLPLESLADNPDQEGISLELTKGDHFEFLVTDKSKCNLGVRVKDSRGLATDPVIGTYKIKLDTLLDNLASGNDWFNLTPTGRVRLGATWKPIALKGAAASKNYLEPIGSIRLHIMKAGEELRNLEAIGKVDPYIRVFLNGFQRGRTMAIPSTLSPTWDEVVYIPVKKAGQRLVIEAMDAENLGKDRSLGQFELNTADFITKDEDGEYREFIDPKIRKSSFTLDKKSPKGSLLYTLSFFPSVKVLNPDVAEDLRKEAEKKIAEAEKKAADGVVAEQANPSIEITAPDDDNHSLRTTTTLNAGLQDIPLEELIKNESGIAAITFMEARMYDTDLFIRVFIDDAVYPAYSTPRITNKAQALGESGEVIVRELEWSQITFQVTSKVNKPKKDEIIASYKVDTLALLKRSYKEPYVVTIKNGNNNVASATIRMRYFPLLMELDPSESVNNMGLLNGQIVKAENVPAADRSGYSDPYTNVVLNGQKIYKTKIVKKTLNPVWNESFSAEILSRINDKLTLECYDWDMGPGSDDYLGEVDIDLANLEPLTPTTLTLPLKGKSGTITVNLLFKPSYVARKVDTAGIGATFSSGAAIPGKIIGSAGQMVGGVAGGAGRAVGGVADGAGKVVGGVSGGAGKIVGGVAGGAGKVLGGVSGGIKGGTSKLKAPFKFGGSSNSSKSDEASSVYNLEPPSSAVSSGHQRSPSSKSISSSAFHGSSGQGAAGQINISYATGFSGTPTLQVKAFVAAHKKEKELYKTKSVRYSDEQFTFDETFPINATPDTAIIFKVREHRSLGRTEELGEVAFTLGDQPIGQPITLPVKDLGELTFLIDYSKQA
ncbi:hypothetical protein DV113_001019 [Geotrichum candidum]|nr:hypothetical protein DV452_002871 [Geotrichum candidum]KAF7500917.1 hypothetical protein DV113_001019 [Geotrichum candidum]KAI8134678.1 hypothetical protein DUD61_001641 [Geotrichum candidum]KAI9212975.1 hypothetical protein DS838_002175 [Geotrichum bryndzae]